MNTKYLFFASYVLLLVGLCASCYYDNKDDLYDVVIVPGEVGPCDFTTISYSVDLVPIINLQCNDACHNAVDRRGNIVLETHGQVMPYINDGSFLGSIKYEAGFAAMPPGIKMIDCDISKIEFWINNGAPNN